jgi:hypothetical protein
MASSWRWRPNAAPASNDTPGRWMRTAAGSSSATVTHAPARSRPRRIAWRPQASRVHKPALRGALHLGRSWPYRAARRLVHDVELDVRGEGGDEGDLLAVPLEYVPHFFVGSSWKRRISSSRRRAYRPPRRWPSRSITSPPDWLGQRRTSAGTYARRRCSAKASRQGSPPSSETSPASRRSRPRRMRMVVDFPAPLGPRKPRAKRRNDHHLVPAGG